MLSSRPVSLVLAPELTVMGPRSGLCRWWITLCLYLRGESSLKWAKAFFSTSLKPEEQYISPRFPLCSLGCHCPLGPDVWAPVFLLLSCHPLSLGWLL